MHVIEIYTDTGFVGLLKSVSQASFAITTNIKYAKKYKDSELNRAQGDCDHVTGVTNGKYICCIH